MLHGDYEDKGDHPRLFLGYRYFKESSTSAGICDSCFWMDNYYSHWNNVYSTLPSKISSISPSEQQTCYYIQRDSSEKFEKTSCYVKETYDEQKFLGALCEYRECKIETDKVCIFPFKYAGRTYDKCTTVGFGNADLPAWCSLQVRLGHRVHFWLIDIKLCFVFFSVNL